MGTSHLSPTGTRRNSQNLIDYKGNHVELEHYNDEFIAREQYQRQEKAVINHLTDKFGFLELSDHEWINDRQKVVAVTGHGVELRELIHPSGTTLYFYICVVSDNWEQTNNLGLQHMETYVKELREVLKDVFGTVKTKTSAWTSAEVEV